MADPRFALKIAFYFSNAHLGRWNWPDFVAGQVPMSGTDAQFLHLMLRMGNREDIAVLPFFSGTIPGAAPQGAVAVGDIAQAAAIAKASGADTLLFNNRNIERTLGGLTRCAEIGLPALVWDQNGPYPAFRDALFQQKALRRLVVVSASHADTLRHHPIFSKCSFIHNALLFASPQPGPAEQSRAMTVAFLGATIPQKGFHHLVRAWPTVRNHCPEARLVIVGGSRLYDRARPVGPLGLCDAAFEEKEIFPFWGNRPKDLDRLGIRLMSLLPPVEVQAALRRCAITVVNPCARNGSFETFCVSAIEAQAAGCAVIGGRRLGLRESVRDGVTGILIRREADLAKAILTLMRNQDRSKAMGTAASIWVREKFSTANADRQWIEIFRCATEGRPLGPPRFQWRLATPGSLCRETIRVARQTPLVRPVIDRALKSRLRSL